MNIVVNGTPRSVERNKLDLVLIELGYQDAVVVTAVNGDFVSISERSGVMLQEGDLLEIVAPMQGG